MTAIPEGLEPLAEWGPHAPGWADGNVYEKIAWAKAHIDRAADAIRAEFYLTADGPVARVRYFAFNADGRKYHDPAAGGPALEPEPVVVPLAELPPRAEHGPAIAVRRQDQDAGRPADRRRGEHMDDLTAFLAARYDEAEAIAKAAMQTGHAASARWAAGSSGDGRDEAWYVVDGCDDLVVYHVRSREQATEAAVAAYVADVDPAHRLADIALKRAILADHERVPDYKPETLALYPDRPQMAQMATCQRCHKLNPDAEIDEDRCDDLAWPCATVRQLGTEFSDHPGYKAEWAP